MMTKRRAGTAKRTRYSTNTCRKKQSKIDIIKKNIGLSNTDTGSKIAKRVLNYSGNSMTRAKLMISRCKNKSKNCTFIGKTTKIVTNLTKEWSRPPHDRITAKRKNKKRKTDKSRQPVPSSIIFLKSKSTSVREKKTR